MREHVKRNSEHESGKGDTTQDNQVQGVGGRQDSTPATAGGGGYQDICSVLNFDPTSDQKKRDPRLAELREMGLRYVWINIAEEVGVDVLLKIWRILDRELPRTDKGANLVVPSYSSFIRYQRNRYIESLAAGGMKPREIQEKLKAQLCEQVSIRHISRLITQD